MKHIKLLCAGLLLTAQPALWASCNLSIANMTWLSASIFASVAGNIIEHGYDCKVELVPGDTVPTVSSMLTRNKPDIAPELWANSVPDFLAKMEAGDGVLAAGDTFGGMGGEAFYIPDYLQAEYPDIQHVDDIKKHWKLFTTAENPDKGRFYGCPPGWACEITTRNFFKAYGLDEYFEYFSPGSGANLKASIARQVQRKRPLFAYYWSPTVVIGAYNLQALDMDAFDTDTYNCAAKADCANPGRTNFSPAKVVTAVVARVRDEHPDIYDYLGKIEYDVDGINRLLAWADENSASSEEAALRYLKTETEWHAWVTSEAKQKVLDAL